MSTAPSVCECVPNAPSVCALGCVKCREQNFTAGYTLYNYVCDKKKKIQNRFFFFTKPIMVKCLNIGKNIGRSLIRMSWKRPKIAMNHPALHNIKNVYIKMSSSLQVHLNKLECRGKVHLFQ